MAMAGQAEYIYDLFISYADADRAWVEGYLLDALTQAGMRCHSESAFALGVPRLLEFERAIQQSQRTLLVLSPAYLAEDFAGFTDLLAQSYGLETATWPLIPLVLQPVELPPRLGMLTTLEATDLAGWPAVVARLCVELQHPVPGPAPRPSCPYPGMQPFGEADSARFFGRDKEIQELLERLRLHPFLTVIGPSGSGKSSLVFAGLAPALRKSTLFGPSEWQVRSIRPGPSPLTTLQTALAPITIPQSLPAHLQPPTSNLLLIVDQFEELFTLSRADVVPFQQALRTLAQIPACYVVLTVRADFYPDLMAAPLWPGIQAHRVEVLPLDEDGLRQAIVRPAEDVGVFVETALVERLVADAAGEPGVLPLVQETLVLLWEHLERRFLPLSAYEALGSAAQTGLQVAMARRADAVLAGLTPEQQAIARRIFLRLVQFGEGRADTRRQQLVMALRVAGDDPVAFDRMLERLADSRLLTLSGEEGGNGQYVDIAHEALITGWPALQGWLSERREAEQARRRLEAKAVEWLRLGQGVGGLLDEVELVEMDCWLASPDAVMLGHDEALLALAEASRIAVQRAEAQKEAVHRRELEQAQALAQAERRRKEAQVRGSRRVWGVVSGFALLLIVAWLSFSPVNTGWRQMDSFDESIAAVVDPRQLVIAVSASNPDLLYVSDGAAGGLYESRDGGVSWFPIGAGPLAGLPVLGIAASEQMVYVTTPEDIFVSEDRGDHWARSSLPMARSSCQQPWAIAVNPRNPLHAYVGTRYADLFATADGGSTWSPVETPDVSGDWVQAVATTGTYVAVATDRGLWTSTDAGQTWQPFAGQATFTTTVSALTMVGQQGRFFAALGAGGVGDADVSSGKWIPLKNAPPSPYIGSISASGDTAFYASSERGLLCKRIWYWTNPHWWRFYLGLDVPCHPR